MCYCVSLPLLTLPGIFGFCQHYWAFSSIQTVSLTRVAQRVQTWLFKSLTSGLWLMACSLVFNWDTEIGTNPKTKPWCTPELYSNGKHPISLLWVCICFIVLADEDNISCSTDCPTQKDNQAVHQIKSLFSSCVADVCSSSVFIWFYLCFQVCDLTPAEVDGVLSLSLGYIRSIHLKLTWYSKPLWHLPALVMFLTFYHSHSLQMLMRRQQRRFPDANKAFFSWFLEKPDSIIAITMGHRPPSLSNLLMWPH